MFRDQLQQLSRESRLLHNHAEADLGLELERREGEVEEKREKVFLLCVCE